MECWYLLTVRFGWCIGDWLPFLSSYIGDEYTPEFGSILLAI